MLPLLLFNVVSGLIADKAQNLVKEHVEDMIDNILPDDAAFVTIADADVAISASNTVFPYILATDTIFGFAIDQIVLYEFIYEY